MKKGTAAPVPMEFAALPDDKLILTLLPSTHSKIVGHFAFIRNGGPFHNRGRPDPQMLTLIRRAEHTLNRLRNQGAIECKETLTPASKCRRREWKRTLKGQQHGDPGI